MDTDKDSTTPDKVSLSDMELRQRTPEDTPEETEPQVETDTSKLTLKKEIGLFSGIAFVVGSIIGSGIFITPQGVLRNTGSVGLCMVVWSSGAVLAILGSLTFTELTSVTRTSGGEYAVLMKTFGPIPAFMFVWAIEIARNPASRAVQCLTFAEYFSTLLELCGSPETPKKLIAICVLVLLAITTSYSVKLSARIQVFFTAAKLGALVVIIIGGLVKIGQGTLSELPTGFEGTVTVVSDITLAYYSVMFAYNGWNNVNFLIEEVKNPQRNGPLSSIIGVSIVAVVYILTNISYLAVMTRQELYQSSAVAQTWGDRVLGSASWIIPISVMMSVFGSANGGMGTNSRIQFAAARDGNWWEFLSFINVKRYTPMPPIICHVLIAIFMVLQGTITSLITFLSFTNWVFYGACALSCIVLRFKVKDDPKRIKIPILIPIIFMLLCLFLVVAPIVDNPRVELLYAVAFVVGGLIIYFPLIYFNLKPRWFEKIEMYLQLLLEVAPSTYVDTS
ncbi:b(0,+)-type amino acid transporter 1-like isoform X1 [Haliotis rubra]|uniref:b(0,+)-type amino acid transporter 1-like isoform X1 n=1 Tax=Haliotis rubra TaxID=36100 RepID=UPI001EE5205B|nr:b(0,+)-type amino acid transporter 1-like isoform X1 [Haliotis rubra]